jgi:hypothetical protein
MLTEHLCAEKAGDVQANNRRMTGEGNQAKSKLHERQSDQRKR